MMPLLAPLARPERQVLLWTQPRVPAHFATEAFPVFSIFRRPNGHFYGFPIYGVPGLRSAAITIEASRSIPIE